MGKMKAVAAEGKATCEAIGAPALIVFGRDERGRPHASTFVADDKELAQRAAGLMAMQALPITADEHRAVASELPAGKIFASGKAFVPFCAEGAYKRLEALPGAFQPAAAAPAEPLAHQSVPATWAAIGVGALVLASEGLEHGYFEAVVESAPGEDVFELRWRHWPNLPALVRGREHLALLTPSLAAIPEQRDGPAVADEAQAADA